MTFRLFRPWLAGADRWEVQRQHSEVVDPTDALVTAREPLERHHACHVLRMRPSSIAKSTFVTGTDGSVGASDDTQSSIPLRRRERYEEVRKRAFAMPLMSPAFPPGPYRFINREYLIITYRT